LDQNLRIRKTKKKGYNADGSDPARSLTLRSKDILRMIEYKGESDLAIIVLKPN
jgi:methenyltetrahydromethanopterin cyclohydrolase